MEQMYLVEIFIDKITIFASDEDEKSGANKNLIIKIRFGPKVQFIIKEGQLARNEDKKDDIIECDDLGRRKWTRTIRVGKSYLFPSYPDTVLMILSKFPLEIEVWNDDANEVEIFVGIGTMYWETEFYHMLKDTADACKPHDPLSIKQHTPLFAECCCKQVGEIGFILRLSALGDSIITEFQQLMKDPDAFVFRTNKAPSMFQCKRIEGDDPNFCMVGSLYETTTLEDPAVLNSAEEKLEVCTQLQSCGIGQKYVDYSCEHNKEEPKKRYPIDKIRMGDITGPCGNANCPLAHKVRTYIRNLDAYKQEATNKVSGTKDNTTRKICGACDCKDDRWHRDECPDKENKMDPKVLCTGCGGIANSGHTCDNTNTKDKEYSPSADPSVSKTQVNYIFSVNKVDPDLKDSMFGKDFIVENSMTNYNFQFLHTNPATTCQSIKVVSGCCCRRPQVSITKISSTPSMIAPENNASSSLAKNNQTVYNMELRESKRKLTVYNCIEIPEEKDYKCDPPKLSPPCKTFDCDCIAETSNIATRKAHKPYCPSYKHKSCCPVTMMHEEEDKKKLDEDEDEAEPLPYGLPPIQLGPCPVMGRPCTVPDGFARMYKTATLPALPPSYNNAGKVCCSKEYERIKKAIKDYLKNEKDHDYRCINKFNVDTERRCCDKEQQLLSLMGKACCGSHKMAIQEKFKEDKK
ncbi:uncharacterized protein LOC128199952 [Galleria mellonella]|uniref:Uncharacterized protein LOC128199952 n=1 Tax=Galleria mellonella TaxID=7137 RepID=A0A6J1X4C0_GALME|nr:uncharacterized protein LOC128199952 [Galleria mellonella]